jgi:ABC-type histidine transport system ATPase subunit
MREGEKMAATPIIVADNVTKRFGAHQVLTRVTLPVMERDVVCIVAVAKIHTLVAYDFLSAEH